MKKYIVLIIIIAASIIGLLFTVFLVNSEGTCYYAQIDNTKIEKIESRKGVIDLNGGMEYKYTLPAYGENGKETTISFGTMRQLKDGAYLKLWSVPFRGVVKWEEVTAGEMPKAVQEKIT